MLQQGGPIRHIGDQRVSMLGWPAPDGTFRARIFIGGRKTWECEHLHETLEEAWECGRSALERLAKDTG